jgi:hypothetical protein
MFQKVVGCQLSGGREPGFRGKEENRRGVGNLAGGLM